MTSSNLNQLPFDKNSIDEWSRKSSRHKNWPVVYTIFNEKQIYVGETTSAANRLHQHINSEAKNHLEQVRVIIDDSFNKSVCLDLESHLIRLFDADDKYDVVNLNGGLTDSDYYDRDEYRSKFKDIFEELRTSGMLTRPIPQIINSDIFKYSPYKALNAEQALAVNEILENLLPVIKSDPGQTFVVQGDPGTGKTIVAIYLLKLLHDIEHTSVEVALENESVFSDFFLEGFREALSGAKIGLVIPQQSLRKTIQRVFDRTPGLSGEQVMSANDAASSGEFYDLLIVDEAHRLQQRANQSAASLNTKWTEITKRLFGKDDKSVTQLDWIRQVSRHQLLLLDALQTVKPMDLAGEVTKNLVSEASASGTLFRLQSQMRLLGGDDYISYVGDVFAGKNPPPRDNFGTYDLQFFGSFNEMKKAITALDENPEIKLSRLVAGYGWKWISKGGKSPFDFEIEGTKLTWNRTAIDWINSESSSKEVGSIHTVQGYDLNYAGVIVGPELGFDKSTNKLVFHRSNYHDAKGKQNNTDGKKFTDSELLEFVGNIYRVLMTRGIRGTYVYVVDPELREYLRKFF